MKMNKFTDFSALDQYPKNPKNSLSKLAKTIFVFAIFATNTCSAIALEQGKEPPYYNINSAHFQTAGGNPFTLNSKYECTWGAWGFASANGWQIKFSKSSGRHAKYWPDLVTNSRGITQTPTLASIYVSDSGTYGHIGFVVKVIDSQNFIIDEYNFIPKIWSRRKMTITRPGRVKPENANEVSLRGFIIPPLNFAKGLFKSQGESSVFELDGNGNRSVLDSWDLLVARHGNNPVINEIPEPSMYGRTNWSNPMPHLYLHQGTVYWIRKSVNNVNSNPLPNLATGGWVKQAFTNMPAFLGESHRTDQLINTSSLPGFLSQPNITSTEPYLRTIDGPFLDRLPDGTINAGYRVMNFANVGNLQGITVRAVRESDGKWFDFPWSPSRNIPQGQSFVNWSQRRLDPGTYRPMVIYSYWMGGKNYQFEATGGGLVHFPFSREKLIVK